MPLAALIGVLLLVVASPKERPARHAEPSSAVARPGCDGGTEGYRVKGRALRGDVDGDGGEERVTVRVDRERPPRCRHLLVAGTTSAAVTPLPWPGTGPKLLLLAEIDARAGVEPVVSMSPAAVYRPGAVFTVRRGRLVRMRPRLLPLADEFPSGVDCAGAPGTIVVTTSQPADPDTHWEVTRTTRRAAGRRFVRVDRERSLVEVGSEIVGKPFRSC